MKKVFKFVAALLLIAVLFTGCNRNGNKNNSSTEASFTYWVSMPPEVISVYKTMADMGMFKELEKKTGKRIDFTHPPQGQVDEQFNLMVVSRELTDMVEYYWSNYPGGPDKAISDGTILDLTDLIREHAPNYWKAINDNPIYKKQVSTDSGKLYGFAALNTGKYRTFGGMLIRQDWLDDLGLPLPETIEDWETTLRAFKEKKDASAPLTFVNNIFNGNHFNNAFDVGLSLYVDNNKIKLPQIEPSFKEYVSLMHKWYKEGLLDNEYDTNNDMVVDAKMTSGVSGATYGYIGGTIGKYVNAMKEREPSYRLAATQFPVKNVGDQPRFLECQKEANDPFVAITSACKDPVAAVKWLDYFYSEEGMILKNFGVEGETFNKVNGRYIYTDEILNNPKGYSIAEAMSLHFRANRPAPGYNQHEDYLMQYYQLPEQREALVKWSQYTPNATKTILPPITATVEESERLITLFANINTYSSEMVLKFIKGTEPMSKYDDFVAQLIKIGADEYVELNQKAFDRYINR